MTETGLEVGKIQWEKRYLDGFCGTNRFIGWVQSEKSQENEASNLPLGACDGQRNTDMLSHRLPFRLLGDSDLRTVGELDLLPTDSSQYCMTMSHLLSLCFLLGLRRDSMYSGLPADDCLPNNDTELFPREGGPLRNAFTFLVCSGCTFFPFLSGLSANSDTVLPSTSLYGISLSIK